MAYTTLASLATGTILTATYVQQIKDNFDYLKGTSGAIALDNRISVPATTQTSGSGWRAVGASSDVASLQGYDASSISAIFFATNRQYDGSNWQLLNTRAGANFQITQDAFTWSTFPASSTTATTRMTLDNTGKLGIGTASPQGPLHIAGTSQGWMFLAATSVVGTLQTIAVAGTIANGATFWIADRNTTTGSVFTGASGPALLLGASGNYVTGADTITYSVTAGGAVTVQRTGGSSGPHHVSMLIFYF